MSITQTTPAPPKQLFDPQGRAKFVSPSERNNFLVAADRARPDIRTLAMLLAYTGCHPSEAVALTVDCFDIDGQAVTFNNAYRRKKASIRCIPAPPVLMGALLSVHDLRNMQKNKDHGSNLRPWPMHRSTVFTHISKIMHTAQIEGPQATPRGLRHAFALDAINSGVPVKTLQYWLGHSELKNTLIYTDQKQP